MNLKLKQIGRWILCACMMLASGMAYADVNPKPFVIPELQSWTGAEGEVALSGVVCVKGGNKELMRVAKAFAADYEAMFGKALTVKSGSPKAGDILFVLKKGFFIIRLQSTGRYFPLKIGGRYAMSLNLSVLNAVLPSSVCMKF